MLFGCSDVFRPFSECFRDVQVEFFKFLFGLCEGGLFFAFRSASVDKNTSVPAAVIANQALQFLVMFKLKRSMDDITGVLYRFALRPERLKQFPFC